MAFKHLIRFLPLTAVLVAPVAMAQVSEFSLANGMQVIVKEDHRAPVVVSQVWYKVGSSYEPDGLTGISHALEHMMFKGTESVGPGEFSRTISALGGDENAFTSRDYTAYFEMLASEHLEKALELEADRMRNLLLDPVEFAKEIEVVKEERRLRTEDKPSGKVYEQFSAVAWRASTYRNPVIGWMTDLDNMTNDDLVAWYRRWYAPNNATLVVVGDVDPGQVRSLAERYFAGIATSEIPALKPVAEPAQSGETRVEVRVPARQPYLMLGYKAPIIGTAAEPWEPYALYVLANVLDGGNSARLSRDLVRGDAIAASAGAEYGPYSRLPGMFLLDGTPTDGHTTAELEQALRAQVERLRAELIDEGELKRIVTQAVASKVYEADSLFAQAMEIGMLETIGLDWRLLKTEIDAIKAVTPEQVRSVAERYLTDDNLTVATLAPLPMDGAARVPRSAAAGVRHDS
ncbi:MAG: insulinase family protein [Gammaproteobacteria bacterium]|nr:insulinase family protein [Gammaproteobacteria bacterium]